jgi:hypothetical protein
MSRSCFKTCTETKSSKLEGAHHCEISHAELKQNIKKKYLSALFHLIWFVAEQAFWNDKRT